MRLYHSRFISLFWVVSAAILLAGCATRSLTQAEIAVDIFADGKTDSVHLSPGATVQDALSAAVLSLDPLDRVEPPLYSIVSGGLKIVIVRVREEFKVEQEVIPFGQQVIRNENLPEGETRLVQSGVNGVQETTYRRVLEDGQEVSYTLVKTVVVNEAEAEILMVGNQPPYVPISIPGRLAYLQSGNAWLIEKTTGERKPIVASGDLDGRVFSLSPDGEWLLFTRRTDEENKINTLWVAKVGADQEKLVDLKVSDVIHFAGWRPGSSYTIAFSTVEPRDTAPGWQANNDLRFLSMDKDGKIKPLPSELETNMGGRYGWWGTSFAWAPDGSSLAYARPDGLGLFFPEKEELSPLLDLLPFQTGGDWAWVPGLAWGQDMSTLYTVDHLNQAGSISPEASAKFDLTAIPLNFEQTITETIKVEAMPAVHLVSQTGLFAYPQVSPVKAQFAGQISYFLAYLQALSPAKSENSLYQVAVMDRDGSNRRVLFPASGEPGLDPYPAWGAWSPEEIDGWNSLSLAVLYQDNLWLLNAQSGEAYQVTGDSLVRRVDWK